MFDLPNAGFDQDFQHLTRTALDHQLAMIFRHWDAQPLQRAEFVGWAWVVAAASDFTASEDAQAAARQVRAERDELHRQLAEKLQRTATVDLELVARRMFLDWLCSELQTARAAA